MINKRTKLSKYMKEHKLRTIDVFRATMKSDGKTIDHKTVYNIEHGYTNPLLSSMKAIASALEVPIDVLF